MECFSKHKGTGNVPQEAKDVADQVKSRNGTPPDGYKGGKVYENQPRGTGQKLPEGPTYKEYDVHPNISGQNRGAERIVIGSDGSMWYTNDHYETFIPFE